MRLLNNILILLLTLMLSAVAVDTKAQNNYAQEKELITKIKRSPDTYVFAEATCKTEEEAQAVAEDLFWQEVNEFRSTDKRMQGASDVVVNDSKLLQNAVKMPRGSNMYRVFLYVKKSDILAVNNPVVMSDRLKQKDEEEKASVSAKAKEEKERQEAIRADVEAKVKAEMAAKEKIKQEAQIKLEERARSEAEAQKAREDSIVRALRAQNFPEAAEKVATAKNLNQLSVMLKQMKQAGKVTAYAKYKDMTVKSEWYLVLYDETGAVKALLTDGEDRLNVVTGRPDSLKNYPRHAAIGVKFKK